MIKVKIGLSLITTILFIGCMGMKHGKGSGPISKNYTSFYIGNDSIQYFIKHLELEKPKFKGDNEMDITYRKISNKTETVTVNITSYDKATYSEDINVSLSNTDFSAKQTENPEIFYSENQTDGAVKNRFSTKYNYADFIKIINSDGFSIQVVSDNDNMNTTLKPTQKTLKILSQLKNTILSN